MLGCGNGASRVSQQSVLEWITLYLISKIFGSSWAQLGNCFCGKEECGRLLQQVQLLSFAEKRLSLVFFTSCWRRGGEMLERGNGVLRLFQCKGHGVYFYCGGGVYPCSIRKLRRGQFL